MDTSNNIKAERGNNSHKDAEAIYMKVSVAQENPLFLEQLYADFFLRLGVI